MKLLHLDLLSLLLDMFEQRNLHMLLDKLFRINCSISIY